MKRCSFLKQVADHVEVERWPDASARSLPCQGGETHDALRERREDHLLEVMKKRSDDLLLARAERHAKVDMGLILIRRHASFTMGA